MKLSHSRMGNPAPCSRCTRSTVDYEERPLPMHAKLIRRILIGTLLIGLGACTSGNTNSGPTGTFNNNGVSKGHPGESS